MSENREKLFSLHNHLDGHIALYLEEQDAVKDLVEDVVGWFDTEHLIELRNAALVPIKAEGYFERLDNARNNLGLTAPLLANLSEDEALVLAEDLIRAVKFNCISRKARENYPILKAVK
jgi:hypothetical protein